MTRFGMRILRGLTVFGSLLLPWSGTAALAQTAQPAPQLAEVIAAMTGPLVDDVGDFGFAITAGDPAAPRIELGFRQTGAQGFVLDVRSDWAAFTLARDAERTMLLLPSHSVAFVGEGEAPGEPSLTPRGFLSRLLAERAPAVGLLRAALLGRVRALEPDGDEQLSVAPQVTAWVPEGDGDRLSLRSADRRGFFEGIRRLDVRYQADPAPLALPPTTGLQVRPVSRVELEATVFRAVRRVLQIYAPGMRPIDRRRPRAVEGGELRFVDGHRSVLLWGDPEQIGRAHGQLLGPIVRRMVDSCLHLVGLVETVRTGKWFPDELAGAYRRLHRFVPDRHRRELDALADAIPDLSRHELRLASVFPEYFHCSGFAVFGEATVDGVLYHGRVLDYMTMIGLQQAAVTFIVKPERGYGFVNVGFAGFIGSVTGMNEREVSLGEMGGRGRGEWDGVPMATLMRRALEECATLEEVQDLWRRAPRTCEYYYVFADGKNRSAVGVAATPESIEFVPAGATHPLLKGGIEDTVILSAGDRLDLLHRRIREGHGRIDEAAAIRLMDRPVAMSSNLHDALMVPERGLLHVAVAGATEPAAAMPYVRIDFRSLLEELLQRGAPRTFFGRDSLPELVEPRDDARAMLRELWYEPCEFDVEVRPRAVDDDSSDRTATVRFASPRSGAQWDDDPVVLEWYAARGRQVARNAPAVLVLHILDGRMRVARGIARGLCRNGIHAFVIHLPGYGERTDGSRELRDPRRWLALCRQAVVDARRARDAIAALPGIDPWRVSIQGTSLGGVFGAVAASLDAAFDQSFLFLAGGDMRALFENGQGDSAKMRDSLRGAGMTDEEIVAALSAVDPARVAHRLDPARTWLYSARFDSVVPPASARALGEAVGLDAEHHLWFDATHYSGVVMLPDLLRHMVARIGGPQGALQPR